MRVKVFAPLIGEGVDELSVVAWKIKLGDAVQEDQGIVEVESDKVVTEVQSPAAGTVVEMAVQAGDQVSAGGVLAVVETEAVQASPTPPPATAPIPAAPASPIGGAEASRARGALRKKIALRMLASQHDSAQVLTVMEADMSAVVAHRAASKEAFAKEGIRLTLSAYFVAALASALRLHPELNSSWGEEGMILHRGIHIGVAVSLGEEGLIVPVVKDADTLGLGELARSIESLAAAARSGTLRPEDVKGGTFTLTNHGTGGSLFATPIINQPQVGILGAGSLQKRAVVVAGQDGADSIEIRPMVYLSLVFDHRALDGAGADGFLRDVKAALEGWAPA